MRRPLNFYVVQHEDVTTPGSTLEWCRSRDIEPIVLLAPNGKFPVVGPDDAVILLGGTMNVAEEDEHPWLKAEKTFIRALLENKRRTLGICLGAQLIADALGARVSKHAFAERGLETVRVQRGLALPSEGTEIPVMQWHEQSFDLPRGAVSAFEGEAWKNQGFKYGDAVLATQFHPEADEEFVESCYEEAELKKPAALFERRAEMQSWYFRLLDGFFLGAI